MIFYFSGTGNSKFAAERIAEKTGQRAIDITGFKKIGDKAVFSESGPYLFSCPCYMSTPAKYMTEFIESAAFPGGVRAYFLITAAASSGASARVCRELCEKKGMEYMGCAELVMPQNYIALFTMKDNEENLKIVKDSLPVIDRIAETMKNGGKLEDKNTGSFEYAVTKWVRDVYYKCMKTKKFHTTDACVSCGYCADICPLSNISITDGKPHWGKDCTHCMACINRCPKDAIEYGKGSVGKPRYKGPDHIIDIKETP